MEKRSPVAVLDSRAHDRGLTIVDAARLYAGSFANRGVCAVRGNDQARAQLLLGASDVDAHTRRFIPDLDRLNVRRGDYP